MTIMLKDQKSLTQIRAIETPTHTDSWRPISYGDAIDFVRLAIKDRTGSEPVDESYGLGRDGSQLFALFKLQNGYGETQTSIGLRGSYDKSLAWGLCGGESVLVCDNLCFSGDAFKVMRKNTVNVWQDFMRLVFRALQTISHDATSIRQGIAEMKTIPCPTDRGYELLGRMMGHGLLAPQQASIAFKDWQTPRHEEFSERDMWGLYNCVTEGLKKGTPGQIIDRHVAAHSFFADAMAEAKVVGVDHA